MSHPEIVHEFIDCCCGSPYCRMEAILYQWESKKHPEDNWPSLLFQVYLEPKYGFFRRLWNAFKYVFLRGKSCEFWSMEWCGSEHEMEELNKFRSILDQYESAYKKWSADVDAKFEQQKKEREAEILCR